MRQIGTMPEFGVKHVLNYQIGVPDLSFSAPSTASLRAAIAVSFGGCLPVAQGAENDKLRHTYLVQRELFLHQIGMPEFGVFRLPYM